MSNSDLELEVDRLMMLSEAEAPTDVNMELILEFKTPLVIKLLK